MAYIRKTRDEWQIQGDYGCGWECVFTADNKAKGIKVALTYEKEEPQYPHRLVKKRVPIMA